VPDFTFFLQVGESPEILNKDVPASHIAAQIHGALAYYQANRDEVEKTDIAAEEAAAEEIERVRM
jgi:hypothetical protein